MFCIHCGYMCDWHPSYTCSVCRAQLVQVNKHEHLLYLLREAYKTVSEIRLRRQIEMALGIIPEEVPQRSKLAV